MTSNMKTATGIYVMYNGTVYAELTDVNDPPFTMSKIDGTSHDSDYEVQKPGIGKFGDLTMKAFFVNDTAQAAMRVAALAKTVGTWQIVYPSAYSFLTYSCPGFISSLKHATPQKGAAATYEISITPTEAVTEITTSGQQLQTTFNAVSEKGGSGVHAMTPTPAFAAAVYVNDITMYADSTGFHVVPVSTGTMYYNGTLIGSTGSTELGYSLADYPSGSVYNTFVVAMKTSTCVPYIYKIRMTRGLTTGP